RRAARLVPAHARSARRILPAREEVERGREGVPAGPRAASAEWSLALRARRGAQIAGAHGRVRPGARAVPAGVEDGGRSPGDQRSVARPLQLELAEVFRVEPFEIAAQLLGLLLLGQLARLGLGLALRLRLATRGLFPGRRLEQRLVDVDGCLGAQRER